MKPAIILMVFLVSAMSVLAVGQFVEKPLMGTASGTHSGGNYIGSGHFSAVGSAEIELRLNATPGACKAAAGRERLTAANGDVLIIRVSGELCSDRFNGNYEINRNDNNRFFNGRFKFAKGSGQVRMAIEGNNFQQDINGTLLSDGSASSR